MDGWMCGWVDGWMDGVISFWTASPRQAWPGHYLGRSRASGATSEPAMLWPGRPVSPPLAASVPGGEVFIAPLPLADLLAPVEETLLHNAGVTTATGKSAGMHALGAVPWSCCWLRPVLGSPRCQLRSPSSASQFPSQPSSQMLSLLLLQPMKPLKATATTSQPVLTLQQIETIFYKIQDIYEIHKEFYDSLCPKVQQWDSNVTMGHLFQKLVRVFPGACSVWKRRRAREMEHRAAELSPMAWLSSRPALCSLVAVGLAASLAACPSPPVPGRVLLQPPCPSLQRGCPRLAGPACDQGGVLAGGARCCFTLGLAGAQTCG